MSSAILASARSGPRTTIAGVASFLAFLGGMIGTYQTGQIWPVVAGIVCSKIADLIHAALAADAKEKS